MQIFMSYDALTPYDGELTTPANLRDFVYSNKTKTIYSYVGDHVIGENEIQGFEIIAKQFKYV